MRGTAAVLGALRYAWAFPWTLVGFLVGVATLLSGGSGQRVGAVVEFSGGFATWLLESRLFRASAMTIGYVVIGRTVDDLDGCRRHELVHVRQYGAWGPFFVPAYLASSVVAWMRGGNAYLDNAFEREAFEEAQ